MSTPPNENARSLPSASVDAWKRVIWVNLIEIALFCTIPVIISPPEAYPTGTQFIGWAIFGLFYVSAVRAPGLIGDTPGYVMTLVLFLVTLVFFILNVATHHSVITKENRGQLSSRGIRLRLKLALYGPAIFWLVPPVEQALETFVFCGEGYCFILIPIYFVIWVPWALRFRYSKTVIQGFAEGKDAIKEPLDEAWAAPVRKAILELGTKYTRLQINEIAEKVNIKNEKQIVAVVQDMIKQGQIVAEYFKSSRSVAFDQQANTAALAKFITDLDGQFTAWGKENKKV